MKTDTDVEDTKTLVEGKGTTTVCWAALVLFGADSSVESLKRDGSNYSTSLVTLSDSRGASSKALATA